MWTRRAIPYISLFCHQQTHTALLSVINKIHNKIKFFYRKNRFLSPTLRGLLFNELIEPHFKYTCSAWYPNLTKKLKSKIQTSQNKCICFCLQLDKMTHTSHKEFEILNWLHVTERFNLSALAKWRYVLHWSNHMEQKP